MAGLGLTLTIWTTEKIGMKHLYIDESGDHNLVKINQNYPVFVLGGVLVDQEYHDRVIAPELDQFKIDFFGISTEVLHLYDARNRLGIFAILNNPTTRHRFWEELRSLMEGWEYDVLACLIDKPRHVARYGAHARDPYHYSLEVLLERFALHLEGEGEQGRIFAEARRRDLDRDLIGVFQWLRSQGTGDGQYLTENRIQAHVLDLTLHTKQENIAGLQLADLVLSPIGRHYLGKQDGPGWRIVESKFRRDPETGEYNGWGLKLLP